jgi:predicted transcriptional regulator
LNAALLIHAIVRQTTVLIAALATASGQRAQLASLANLVFADLVRELREQGLGNKVIADMFGMALRTYHRKLARLAASRTVAGKSLWEAVLSYVQQQESVLRSEVLQRFVGDDEATLRSVLLDLIEAGLVRREGEDDATRLIASELPQLPDTEGAPNLLDGLVMVALHRSGPLTLSGLAELVPTDAAELERALTQLVAAGLVQAPSDGSDPVFSCETCVIDFGAEVGWEAAVFDHYQAMVVALATKLRSGARRADLGDSVGGSTFVFDVWQGHPLQAEVLGFLRATRERGRELRAAVERHNAAAPMPPQAAPQRVTAYVGQSVAETEEEEEHE